jgi:predicted  nucleic acid-binding Zn-ribbon protein
MDETQTEEPAPEKADADRCAQARRDESQPTSLTEINLGDFTRTQGLMKSLRLTLDNLIVVQVEEIASGVSEAGRKFKLGDIEQANIDVTRLYSAFGQRTNQWESQARNLEQQMKMQAAKNPKSISIDKMNRMKAEQTAVRTRIRTAEVQFRRLHQGLDQAFTNLKSQPAVGASELSLAVPSDFLAAFKAATIADRPEIVKECFNVEAVLKVDVTRGTAGGYDIKFDPMPPLGRLYFLTKTAQVVLLEQLGDVVLLQDLEAGQKSELKLVEFVKQVQSGAWLLKPRSGGPEGN